MSTSLTKGAVTSSPLQVLGYSSTQTTGNVLHDIIGRTDMDVSFAAAGLRSGTFTFLFATLALALACRDLHASIGKVTLAVSDLPALNTVYVPSGSITVSQDADSLYWTVEVDYQEVI